MEDEALYQELLGAAGQVGLEVRLADLEDQALPAKSGLVRLSGRPILYLHLGLSLAERIPFLARALGEFDLEAIYLSPAAREQIGSDPGKTGPGGV
jgi:hypothetical protein